VRELSEDLVERIPLMRIENNTPLVPASVIILEIVTRLCHCTALLRVLERRDGSGVLSQRVLRTFLRCDRNDLTAKEIEPANHS